MLKLNRKFFFMALMMLFAGCDNDTLRCKPIIAAYPTWPIVDFSIEDIRWDYFTHLGVVAIYPLADGTLNTQDADSVLPALLAAAKKIIKKSLSLLVVAAKREKVF